MHLLCTDGTSGWHQLHAFLSCVVRLTSDIISVHHTFCVPSGMQSTWELPVCSPHHKFASIKQQVSHDFREFVLIVQVILYKQRHKEHFKWNENMLPFHTDKNQRRLVFYHLNSISQILLVLDANVASPPFGSRYLEFYQQSSFMAKIPSSTSQNFILAAPKIFI